MLNTDVAVPSSVETTGRITRPTMKRFVAIFGFTWLMIGLFTGTIVLVVLVRWLVNLLHHWGLGQTAENRALMLVILLFVVGSFLLSRAIVKRMFRMESPLWRKATIASLLVPGVLSLWAWSNPTRVLASLAGSESTSLALAGGPEFIFGSYPDESRLEALKRQGVTTVVSLQHPAVLVELQGIRDERAATERLGLHFVQAPMLPWVSDNSDALGVIRQLALSGKGKYYIHCGLGRDRVNVARRLVESLGDSTHARVVASGLQKALGFEDRTEPFQRGKLVNIAPEVWVIPFPNPAEMHGFILQGRAGHVFMLLDPADTLQQQWRQTAEQEFRQYAIPYTTIAFTPADSGRAIELAEQLRREKPPVTVIVPATTWTDPRKQISSHVAEAMLKGFGVIPANGHPVFISPGPWLHEAPAAAKRVASKTGGRR